MLKDEPWQGYGVNFTAFNKAAENTSANGEAIKSMDVPETERIYFSTVQMIP